MKRIFLPLFLIASIALVLFLFRPAAVEPIVFKQMSEHAVFNLKDQEQVEAFLAQGFKVVSPHADPQTIVKFPKHPDPVFISNLNIDSPGEVFVINSGGIVVGENAHLDWATLEDQGELLSSTVEVGNLQTSAEVIKNGNVYALAINRGEPIRAAKPKSTDQKPTTFDFPNLEETPVIADE